jgi:predicted adenylyl cyclase CyaB
LLIFFKKKAKLVKKDEQETYYFDTKEDLRIQKNKFFAKIWLKKGKLHDHWREEMEIRFKRSDFKKLEKLFLSLGFKVQIKWFRRRYQFNWQGIKVCLDDTKGYSYIIELEKLASEKNKREVLRILKQKLRDLEIPLTLKKEFTRKFENYKKNWRKLTKT